MSYLSIRGANLKTLVKSLCPSWWFKGWRGRAQNISFRFKVLGFPLRSFSSQFLLKIKGSIIIWREGHLKLCYNHNEMKAIKSFFQSFWTIWSIFFFLLKKCTAVPVLFADPLIWYLYSAKTHSINDNMNWNITLFSFIHHLITQLLAR